MSSEPLDVKLERDIDIKIFEYALKVGQKILESDKDLNPSVRFQFDKKNPNKMIMLIRNDDAATFFSQLEYHINEKFIVEGSIDAKIYYMLLHALEPLIKK